MWFPVAVWQPCELLYTCYLLTYLHTYIYWTILRHNVTVTLCIRSHRAPCSCFPKNVSLQLSSEQSAGDVGTRDYAAGLEESSTGKVPRLQKFCRHNCWVFAAPRKWKRQLTAESAECSANVEYSIILWMVQNLNVGNTNSISVVKYSMLHFYDDVFT